MTINATVATPSRLPAPPRKTAFTRLSRHKGLLIGVVLLAAIAFVAILAPWIAPQDPYLTNIAERRIPPIWFMYLSDDSRATWTHVLGTDKLGRDYLSRLIWGARISLTVGGSVVVMSLLIGATLGIAAGYFGGKVDAIVMYLVTTRLATPVILVALAVVALYGSSLSIIISVLGLLLWDRFVVVLRTATMQIRSLEFVTASVSVGNSTPRVLWFDILPNVLNPLIVVATIEMANAVLYESALSFLGLGIRPPTPSWGLMLAEAKEDIFFSPWVITIPGMAIFVLILAVNLLGDGLRDYTSSRI